MRAYSVDLKHTIVDAVLRHVMSEEETARTFGVGVSLIKRYVRMANEGESLAHGKALGRKKKLGQSGVKLLGENLYSRPAVSYEERAECLHRLLGIRVSKSTIYRMIKCLGYTRKKERGCE
jgi:transposase